MDEFVECGDESPHSTLGGLNNDQGRRQPIQPQYYPQLEANSKRCECEYSFRLGLGWGGRSYFKSFARNTRIFLYDFFDKFNKVIGTAIPVYMVSHVPSNSHLVLPIGFIDICIF